jgi:hypothetical protein
MGHRKHRGLKSIGRALQHGSKEIWHTAHEVITTPTHLVDTGANILQSNFLPILIVGGIVAVVVLRR